MSGPDEATRELWALGRIVREIETDKAVIRLGDLGRGEELLRRLDKLGLRLTPKPRRGRP